MTDPTYSCCDFEQTTSRRAALRTAMGLGAGLTAAAVFGSAFMETSYAATGTADRMLVVLSLRGAADGLSLVVPHGDPVYYAARPSIAVPKANLLAGNAFFGLHPAFAPLLPMWNAGKIAAIHATGQIVTTRSHFAAMEEVEDADPGSSARVGWLNRMLSLRGGTTDLTAMQLGTTVLATQLAGPAPALSAPNLNRLKLTGVDGADVAPWEAGLKTLWANSPELVRRGGQQAIAVANALTPARDASATTVAYPDGDLGDALKETARVLKANVGAEVITVDQGSWDHHEWIGNLSNGNLKRMAEPLAASLAAFFQDLGSLGDRVTVVTISEFGRRVKENSNQGLDHGHGNVMFALGAGVKGGYYGRWPGLENTVDADLAVTTDYRDVLSEVVGRLYPERSLATIFPQFAPTPIGFMTGVIAPPQEPEPEPETPTNPPTTPTLLAMPAGFFLSYGRKAGRAAVGRTLTAPAPSLSARGKAAGVTVSYQWEYVRTGAKRRWGTGRRYKVLRRDLGDRMQVRITYRAKGYKPKVRIVRWATTRRR